MSETMRVGEFELIVLLAVLRLGSNAYGASIRRFLKNEIDRDVSIGALHATTERLQEKGLLTSKIGDPTPERGGRAKNILELTAKGYAAARTAKENLNTMWEGLNLSVSSGSHI